MLGARQLERPDVYEVSTWGAISSQRNVIIRDLGIPGGTDAIAARLPRNLLQPSTGRHNQRQRLAGATFQLRDGVLLACGSGFFPSNPSRSLVGVFKQGKGGLATGVLRQLARSLLALLDPLDLLDARPVNMTPSQRALLDETYRANGQAIWRTVRRLGLAPETAADVVQQTYLVAAERIDEIKRGSEKAFLFSTATNLARTSRRKSARLALSGELEFVCPSSGEETSQVKRQAVLQLLERVIARMAPELVAVFVLYEVEGYCARELAEILHIPPGTVASRLRRARSLLRAAAERLERQGHPPSCRRSDD